MSLFQSPVKVDPIDYAEINHHEGGAVQRVEELMASVRDSQTTQQRQEALGELIELHAQLEEADNEAGAREAEVAFLLLLRDEPDILENAAYRTFVASCVERDSFYRIEWQSAEEVILVAEVLYGFRYQDELTADQLTGYVRDLVRHGLRQFERENQPEEMYELLQRAPIPSAMMDAELVRLRNRLHLYEMRRVRRKRRWLYIFLAVQALLVFILFPVLFQNVENGQIQSQVQQATGLEIVEGEVQCTQDADGEGIDCEIPRQFLDFDDSVYWSVITYGSIGYGDVAPLTDIGKLLAGVHGLMGVLTTGIVAGLVLNWISPRALRP